MFLEQIDLTGHRHHNKLHKLIDVMGTQKLIAKTIIKNDGNYVLALKENHKTLYKDVTLFFKEMERMESEGFTFDKDKTVNGGHGRIETRKH